MGPFFRSFESSRRRHAPLARLRRIPLRLLAPNLVTLFTVGLGLTAIRMAADGRFEWAVGAIVAAALLDGVDGRLARWLKGTSRFGAELDSLADFVNFGVAPVLILYFWGLHDLKSVGWIACLLFAIAAALRLARFNVMLEDHDRPAWQGDFFIGMPAPAGAIVVMLPMYLAFLGLPHGVVLHTLSTLFTLAVGALMVSQVPTLSGKRATSKVPREWVLPLLVAVVAFFALLASFPWEVLIFGTLAYLAVLPLGMRLYRRLEEKYADGEPVAADDAADEPVKMPSEILPPADRPGDGAAPAGRLN
jgi:CDP-diacylglycerol--serine O-phosphatidyltransferase